MLCEMGSRGTSSAGWRLRAGEVLIADTSEYDDAGDIPGSLIPPKATLACNDDNTVDLGDGTKLAFVNGVCTYPDCGLQFGRIKRNWTRHAMVHMKYENKKDL